MFKTLRKIVWPQEILGPENNTGEWQRERDALPATTNDDDKFGPTNLKLLPPPGL